MDNSFYLIDNIFSTKERRKLIKDSKPQLYLGNGENPRDEGIWRTNNLRFHKDFESSSRYIADLFEKNLKKKLEIINVWISFVRGQLAPYYHTHDYDYSCVYYMKTIPFLNSGTSFKFSDNSTQFVKTSQNSSLLFPCSFLHSVPSFFLPISRYTLAMDLVIVQDNK